MQTRPALQRMQTGCSVLFGQTQQVQKPPPPPRHSKSARATSSEPTPDVDFDSRPSPVAESAAAAADSKTCEHYALAPVAAGARRHALPAGARARPPTPSQNGWLRENGSHHKLETRSRSTQRERQSQQRARLAAGRPASRREKKSGSLEADTINQVANNGQFSVCRSTFLESRRLTQI